VAIRDDYRRTDSVRVTIGTQNNEQEQADSAIVAIHENNKTRDRVTGPRHQEATDRVFDHRYITNKQQEPEKSLNRNEIRLLVHRGGQQRQQINNRQCQMTIGTNYRSGSVIVATTQEADEVWTVPSWPSSMNNKRNRQCLRSHRYDVDTGSGQQDTDSAIVAIRNNKQHQRPTVSI
jgi:hypothetical protein